MNIRYIFFILAIFICGFCQAQTRLSVSGKFLYDPDGNGIVPQGFNWGWWGTAQEGDAAEGCGMGANIVRMPIRWYFSGQGSDIRDTTAPGNINPDGLAQLDQYINWCSENKMWIILFGGSDQGAGDSTYNYWSSLPLRQQYIDMWQFLANRYKNTPYMTAYEILSEPHPKKPIDDADLRDFYKQLIDSMRVVDAYMPLIVGPNDHYEISLLDSVYLSGYTNIIYTFNFYLPTNYAKIDKRIQEALPIVAYPDNYIDFDGNPVSLDKDYLDSVLQTAVQFRNNRNVPIFINQVGVRSSCPDYLAYTSDVLDLFKQNAVGYTFWTYRTNSDSLQHGMYWQDASDVYHVKQALKDTLQKAMGGNGTCPRVNVPDVIQDEDMHVFPNPASDHLVVTLRGQHFRVIVSDITGRRIYECRNAYDMQEIDCRNFITGVYTIVIVTDDAGLYRQKMVVVR